MTRKLSYLLRHGAERESLAITADGFVRVQDVIGWHGDGMTLELLNTIVSDDAKGRYEFNADRTMIRARQGHSLEVTPEMHPIDCTGRTIIHGSYVENYSLIKAQGLRSMTRTHVHYTDTDHMDLMRKDVSLYAILRPRLSERRELWISNNNVILSKDMPPSEFTLVSLKSGLVCYGGVIFREDDKNKYVCLVQTTIGVFGFPKGKKNKNENSLQAALREVHEETGLSPSDLLFTENDEMLTEPSDRGTAAIGYFIARTTKVELHVLDSTEGIVAGWYTVDRAMELLSEKRRRILAAAVN